MAILDQRDREFSAVQLTISIGGRTWRADTSRARDLSIPLKFDGPQPQFFGAEPASARTLEAGSFIGDVSRGGTVNCARYSLTPHCNGTHTECLGHVTREPRSVRSLAPTHPVAAIVLSVTPQSFELTEERSSSISQPGDHLITSEALQAAASRAHRPIAGGAVVIRTLPNDEDKLVRNYDAGGPPAYLSAQAAEWLVSHDVQHLIVDVPSIDRASDEGRLTAHRIFWGMPERSAEAASARRSQATITELAFVDSSISDGLYLLNLQVAPFEADAAPSRPILYPVVEQA